MFQLFRRQTTDFSWSFGGRCCLIQTSLSKTTLLAVLVSENGSWTSLQFCSYLEDNLCLVVLEILMSILSNEKQENWIWCLSVLQTRDKK